MKKTDILIFGILLSLSSILVWAEPISGSGEITLPDNFLTNALQPILEKVSLLVGGIFGIYVILAIMQVYRERKKVKLLQDIRNDLDLLTQHFGVKHVHPKRNLWQRLSGLFKSEEQGKKPKK